MPFYFFTLRKLPISSDREYVMREFSTEVESRYSIEKELGRGAMGTVYLARDLMLGETVALKVLNEDLLTDTETTTRFIREISLTRKVTHGNVVRTYEAGKWGSQVFFTMEYIDGVSLKEKYKNTPPSISEAVEIFAEIAKGLLAIHKADIIHRDLKLSNIMMSSEGFIKITDFGIARPKSSDLTGSESMLGTATHMAPEIWRGDEVTKQTDIYALGVIGYELFCGILPFPSQTSMELMFHHIHKNPPSPMDLNPEVPAHIGSLLLQMLQKDPKNRPGSVLDVLYQLEGREEPKNIFTQNEESPTVTSSLTFLEFSTPPATLEAETELLPEVEFKSHNSHGKNISLKIITFCFLAFLCLVTFTASSEFLKGLKPNGALDTIALFTVSMFSIAMISSLGWGLLFSIFFNSLRALSLSASVTILNFLVGTAIFLTQTIRAADDGTASASYEALKHSLIWQVSSSSLVPAHGQKFIFFSACYVAGITLIVWRSLETKILKTIFSVLTFFILGASFFLHQSEILFRISFAEKSFPIMNHNLIIFGVSVFSLSTLFYVNSKISRARTHQ